VFAVTKFAIKKQEITYRRVMMTKTSTVFILLSARALVIY